MFQCFMNRVALSRILSLFVSLLAISASSASESDPPNFLVIAIDDLRDWLGCYGADFVKSPHIDGLAERGILFERAYCQMAVCGPSRSSVFSGARPDTIRAWNNRTHFRDHAPDIVSLPQFFRELGYRTQGFGKVLHDTHRDPVSWTEPFFYPEDPQYARPGNAGKRALIDGIHPENRVNPLVEAADVPDTGYRDGLIAEEAVKAIGEAAREERPFFLFAGFHKPHSPFVAPQRYWDLYDRDEVPLATNPFPPENSPSFSSQGARYLRSFAAMPEEGDFPEPLAREIVHAYLACVSYVDAQVGKLLGALEASGAGSDTIVVLFSDHGYQLGHHNMWCKHSNFETSTRVPFLFVDPRRPEVAGRRVAGPVELVSLYPTLAELAGEEPPAHCEGDSLLAAWNDPAGFVNEKRVAWSRFNKGGHAGRAMRTARFRLVRWTPMRGGGKPVFELFDHAVDPLENRNVAEDPTYRAIFERLRERMNRGPASAG